MEYILSCPCGRQHHVSRSQAGQQLACDCGQALQVPTLRGLAGLPLATDKGVAATQERSPWAGWRGTALAISSAICLLFAAPCGYFLYERSCIDTSYTVTQEIANGAAEIDALSLDMMAVRWFDFEKNGLGPKLKPIFYYYKKYARDREILAGVTGAVALLAGLSAATVWVTTRNPKK